MTTTGAVPTEGSGGATSSTSGAALCGNGVVDAMESCDIAVPISEPGACVAACDDGVQCTSEVLEGAGTCEARCEYSFIEACEGGDGCCPARCTPGEDSDCSDTCGDGVLDAEEQCDIAIPFGMPGSCAASCDDGLACTSDALLNPGTCSAECAFLPIAACFNGDGCCPDGCDDSDCTSLSRIKQSVITADGHEAWSRNAYWDGMVYANWTTWTGLGLTTLVPDLGGGQAYRGIDYVVLADDRVKVTALQLDGKTAWYRYGTWDGDAYGNWTAWSKQFGDLTQIVPGQPVPQAYRAFDHVVLPDGRLKQTLLTFDGKRLWYRYGTWDGSKYAGWTDWTDQYGDLTQLIPGQGMSQSFRSYNHFVFVDKRMKVQVLSEDGRTAWHRYAEWDGKGYANWTPWTDQYGDLSALLPGKGKQQTFLALDEGALAGVGIPAPCQNGCDDDDACTVDACVGNACQHALLPCGDDNLCTSDVCVDGACQHVALDCDDADACTNDACVNGVCQHGGLNCDDGNPCTADSCDGGCQHDDNGSCQGGNCGNCDDGNPCTDDWCDGGCKHGNNAAPCGNGGQCANGSCNEQACECELGVCQNACGGACNQGAPCADWAKCVDGTCQCSGGAFCPGLNKCCPSGDYCKDNNKCCTDQWAACLGRECGSLKTSCGDTFYCSANNGTYCPNGKTCMGNKCV